MSTGNYLPTLSGVLLSNGLPSNSRYFSGLLEKSPDMSITIPSPGTSPDTTSLPPELESHTEELFNKSEYMAIIRKKRSEFVCNFFADTIKELSSRLEEGARKMRICHYEVKFEVPEHFNIEKTENILRDYFSDHGYQSVAEPRNADSHVIILTLS